MNSLTRLADLRQSAEHAACTVAVLETWPDVETLEQWMTRAKRLEMARMDAGHCAAELKSAGGTGAL